MNEYPTITVAPPEGMWWVIAKRKESRDTYDDSVFVVELHGTGTRKGLFGRTVKVNDLVAGREAVKDSGFYSTTITDVLDLTQQNLDAAARKILTSIERKKEESERNMRRKEFEKTVLGRVVQ